MREDVVAEIASALRLHDLVGRLLGGREIAIGKMEQRAERINVLLLMSAAYFHLSRSQRVQLLQACWEILQAAEHQQIPRSAVQSLSLDTDVNPLFRGIVEQVGKSKALVKTALEKLNQRQHDAGVVSAAAVPEPVTRRHRLGEQSCGKVPLADSGEIHGASQRNPCAGSRIANFGRNFPGKGEIGIGRTMQSHEPQQRSGGRIATREFGRGSSQFGEVERAKNGEQTV